jgi:hypothetical protein
MLVNESGNHPNLVGRIDSSILCSLRDGYSAWLHRMIVAESHEMLCNAIAIDLPVGARDCEQLASDMLLSRSAFGCENVRGVRADDGVEWKGERLQTQDIGPSATEHKEDLGVFAKVYASWPYDGTWPTFADAIAATTSG